VTFAFDSDSSGTLSWINIMFATITILVGVGGIVGAIVRNKALVLLVRATQQKKKKKKKKKND